MDTFIVIDILVYVKYYHVVFFISISLVANDV